MKSPAFLLALILGSGCASAAASDSNPMGFYVGGRSDVSAGTWEPPLFEVPGFDEYAAGWKVFLGVHPVRLLAAELSYIDFGHPNGTANAGIYTWHSNVLQRAPTLSGLLYLPIPIPILGVYAKAGIARLEAAAAVIRPAASGLAHLLSFLHMESTVQTPTFFTEQVCRSDSRHCPSGSNTSA